MRLTEKEKFGVVDTSRIYEGLHVSDGFIRNMALHKDALEPEIVEEGEKHFNMCKECRDKKDSFLPMQDE